MRADIVAAEEDTFTVKIKAGPDTLVLHCMVWHARRVQRSSTGERFLQLGLVLVQPSDEFIQLAARYAAKKDGRVRRPVPADLGKKTFSAPASKPTPAKQTEPPAKAEPSIQSFAVRVKQDGGPRTRRLVVGGTNTSEATENALLEIGSGWTILDVRRA